MPARRCHWLAPTSDVGMVVAHWLSGLNLGLQSCIETTAHVHLNAPNPALRARFAWEKHRNEMDEQLFIMLLPMQRRCASADGQWRGQANCDSNHCSRTIKIAKIGPNRCENRARQKMKPFVIGARIVGCDESDESSSLAPKLSA